MTIRVHKTYTVAAGEDLMFHRHPAFNLFQSKASDQPTLDLEGRVQVDLGKSGVLAGVTTQGAANHVHINIGAQGSLEVSTFTDAAGLQLSAAAVVQNRGEITAWSSNNSAVGVRSTAADQPLHGQAYDGYAVELDNLGGLTVRGERSATGLEADNSAAVFNTGDVSVTSRGDAAGFVLHSWGVWDNRGTVEVTGGPTAVGVRVLEDSQTFAPGLRNFGDITVSAGEGGVAIGFDLSATTTPVELDNRGTIKAHSAIHDMIMSGPDRGVRITNSGDIYGDIDLGSGKDTILNTGMICGDIHLGADDDRYSGVYGQAHGEGLSSGTLYGAAYGGAGADTLTGGRRTDVLFGGDGKGDAAGDRGDSLSGMGGDDSLDGGAGADTLIGGEGADRLTGGSGADLFIYTALTDSAAATPDLITDLTDRDRIDLSAIDADTTKNGDQAFHMAPALGGHAGEAALVYDPSADQTQLQLDVDGDGTADGVVLLADDQEDFTGFVL